MQKGDAYLALVREMEAVSSLPARELLALVDQAARVRVLELQGERVELEVRVTWEDSMGRSVRITGHALGPSTLLHERLTESMVIGIPAE